MNHSETKITVADPSALGLFGLAIVTLVASSEKLGWTSGTAFIIPWALFLGAFAQLFAAILDSKKNNVFGMTAFGGYAFFWMGVAMSWLITNEIFGANMLLHSDPKQLGFAFVGYLIFSVYMTIGAMETNKVLFLIFLFIDFLFIGLSLSTLFGLEFAHTLAAWSEFIIAMLSFYGSAGAVLNAHFNKDFVKLGKPFGVFK